MRVCDRHNDRPAVDTLIIQRDDHRIDVCAECKTDVLTMINQPVERPAETETEAAPDTPPRRRKNLAPAN